MKPKESGFRNKKAGMSLIVVLAMIISGLAVLAAPVSIAEEYVGGPYGGTLRVALKSQPSSLNPLSNSLNESANQVIDLLYESLGRIDPYTLELNPWMAESWSIDPNNETDVSVKLKADIMWHDGTPVMLDDIIYSFGPSGYAISYVSNMTKDDANNTIVFHLSAPDSRFFSEMMHMKIVPSGFTSASAPNGCGPFKLESSDEDSMTIVAFNEHFIGRPYLDSITYTYYPYATDFNVIDYPWNQLTEDPRSRGIYRAAYDLMTDKIDFIGWDLVTEDIYMVVVEIDGNLTNENGQPNTLIQNSITTQSNGLTQWHLCFNNAEGQLLNEVALRKAITHSFNKDALTTYDIGGGIARADSIISKFNLPWFNDTIDFPGYDLFEAKKILMDADYADYDGDGWIDKPGPNPDNRSEGATDITLRLYGPQIEDVTPYAMSTNIISWLDLLGIKVELISNTTEVHMSNILAGDFDMYLANQETAMDPQFIYDLYHSENIGSTNILNFQGKYMVENYSLIEQLAEDYGGVNNESRIIQLDHTKLTAPFLVYHNDVLLTTAYDIDMDAGLFTLDDNDNYPIDYLNDTFNITYTYLPFDAIIEKANAQMDPVMRARYIKEAQAILVDMAPSVPLFSYMVSHAYKTEEYGGWVKTLGGINNYWSFTSLKNLVKGESMTTLSAVKTTLNADEEMTLFVKVQDLTSAPLKAELLELTGEGTFEPPVYDEAGEQYIVQYTAPSTASTRTITLGVKAYVTGYSSSTGTLDITVQSIQSNFNIDISRGETSMPSGNTTPIIVIVKDRTTNAVVSEANVVLEVTPAGLGGYLETVSGVTDSSGEFTTVFGSSNVTVDSTFRITAYVSKEGYVDAEQTTSISVDKDPTITVSTDRGLLGLPGPSFLALIFLLSGMSVTYAAYRRKRRY